MILTSSERIAAPMDFVFARAIEFERLARAAEGRGARVSGPVADAERPRYDVQYPFRDELWPVTLELSEVSPPAALVIALQAAVVSARAGVNFTATGAEMTLVELSVEVSPRNMQGRLLLGSLHLVRGRVQERLDGDLSALARGAEALWHAEARG